MTKPTHGHNRRGRASPTYRSWYSMVRRCTNASSDEYIAYGGRGIKVCERWRSSFATFLKDMGPRPEGKTLDRIDNDKDYSPDNCRWSDAREQRRNQRRTRLYTYTGKTMCLTDWIREITGCDGAEAYRLYRNVRFRR